MGFLTDRAVEYNGRLVRANAVSEGDIIQVDDTQAVVLRTERYEFNLADGDEASTGILSTVREHGEGDKVSPHFDETIALTVAVATFDDDGKAHLTEERLFFAEWSLVTVYV